MPLYDVKCPKCGEEFEVFCKIADRGIQICPKCDVPVKFLISHTSKNRDWFRPHWSEHFDTDPVFVKSRGHMKELCLKHDVTSRALGDVRNIREI